MLGPTSVVGALSQADSHRKITKYQLHSCFAVRVSKPSISIEFHYFIALLRHPIQPLVLQNNSPPAL